MVSDMAVADSPPDPMAAQMARLLSASDTAELGEIVRRWVLEAPDPRTAHQYEVFGAKLLELRRAMEESGVVPPEAELAQTLTLMLRLAAQSGGGPMR
ncbi:MAG: hypothetical protein HY908_12685 [Myxococcales bacterium]|nr:hypothetical protein [Myxococcales bacterium]